MRNIPPEILDQIREAIRRPEGTVTFEYFSEDLLNPEVPGGIIFELPSGGHVFRLERTSGMLFRFYHSSPGTGTRVATIDLNKVLHCTRAFIAFSWSPSETKLYLGPRVQGGELYSATGVPTQHQFRVGEDRSIYQVGDDGVEVMGVSIYREGQPILAATAIEAWQNTKRAIEVLQTGTSAEGYLYEVVVTNLMLSILVTGFEAYTKKRFVELEEEGVEPAIEPLIEAFFPKRERDAGISAILKSEADEAGKSVLKHIVDRGTINFQNYGNCRRAYNKGYNIRFGELRVDSETLGWLQRFIKYRHRIIHVSPLLGFLNQAESPPEDPVFPSNNLAQKAIDCFNRFIISLHEASLRLR
jgi:hypothetical protein